MQREIALRRAIEEARNRRQRELDDVVERARVLRRRLRELTDNIGAVGAVHERFAPTEAPAMAEEEASALPAEGGAPQPKVIFAPLPKEEDLHAALLAELARRHAEGFSVGQMRDLQDEMDPGKAHTYDAAWALANALVRKEVLELAGTRPGPAGPIRVLRVVAKILEIPEVT